MKQLHNKDGTPRKRRMDCKVFLLPDEGQVEFADVLARNPASPNVEQLEAVMARHGVKVSRNSLYEFLKSARVQEFQITAGVIRNRLLGQKLATAGADALHADARRLATGYWMTVARCAQEMDGGKRSEETAEQYQARLDRSRAEMEAATDALGTLGCLKAGEDKGAIAVAKLQLEREKVQQAERKLKLLEDRDAKIREIVGDKNNTDYQGKLDLLGKVLEEGFKA